MNENFRKKGQFLYQLGIYGLMGGVVFWTTIFVLWSLVSWVGATHQVIVNYI